MNDANLNAVAVNDGPLDVLVRAFVNARAYAMTAVLGRVIRVSKVGAEPEARVTTVPRVLWAAKVGAVCRAAIDATANAFIRSVVGLGAAAQIEVVRPASRFFVNIAAAAGISVSAKLLARSPVVTTATYDVSALGSKLTGQVIEAEGRAQTGLQLKVLLRNPVAVTAIADIDTNPNTVKRVQFDEYAIESQTFVVRFENNVFYVR